jgi:predicted phosphodiesterase
VIAALYDIHGNLPALEAVLDQISRERFERIVVGGDVVPGPFSNECMNALLSHGLPVDFIRGNGENDVLSLHAGRPMTRVPAAYRPLVQWAVDSLDPDHRAVISRWPAAVRYDLAGVGRVLFCHATPRDDNELFTRLTPAERLEPIFADVEADVVVCGHTHMQFDRQIADVRVVNAGSVGLPFGEPGAYWLQLGPEVQLRGTAYDVADAERRIGESEYPRASDFRIERPPSEADMLPVFEAAALS